jgi:O-antigen ligase
MMSILLFYAVLRISKLHWILAILSVATILIFSDLFFLFLIEVVEFLGLQDYFRIDSIEEGSGRKVAWLFAWTQIQDYFLIGGGFGHDENIMRPNYKWLAHQGHQGGVHNSYLSMWFDSGIIGIILYFSGLLTIIIRSLNGGYLLLAFSVGFFFNITYESWLVASLNPFTIIYLIILTIFVSQISNSNELSLPNFVDEN